MTIENLKNINVFSTFDQKVALLVATFFGAGLAPVAPGTFGSAAGVLVFLGLSNLSIVLYALTVLALLAIGIWAADRVEAVFRKQDDGRIVIDEVVGQLLTLSPLLWVERLSVGSQQFWILLAVGFGLFRLFDIVKPGPVGAVERAFSGGLGVMLDDVVAGILGAGTMGILIWVLREGWLG